MWRKLYRKLKYEYYKLIRMKGDPSKIARGFSVGIFIEFILIPTFLVSLIFLYPLNLLLRSSFSASLIGFVIGKIILPVFMLINFNIGNIIIGKPSEDHIGIGWAWLKQNLLAYLTGSAIMGLLVAFGSYFLILFSLQWYRKKKARRSLAQGEA
ncbi:DUF2062 domain-containing protein [Brevibacillus sp. SYSU BS000544]|uniref:DUF2062 domain-containing protein n=1 Tax=Brevibacillus sp. SYSU BS000544 TaxID=3416443 RepID=UPI003CE4BED4